MLETWNVWSHSNNSAFIKVVVEMRPILKTLTTDYIMITPGFAFHYFLSFFQSLPIRLVTTWVTFGNSCWATKKFLPLEVTERTTTAKEGRRYVFAECSEHQTGNPLIDRDHSLSKVVFPQDPPSTHPPLPFRQNLWSKNAFRVKWFLSFSLPFYNPWRKCSKRR